MPYDKKPGAVTRMYDKKGKPAGLMMEGSVNHMESLNPDLKYGGDVIDQTAQKNEGSMATMDHGDSAAKFTGMSGGSAIHHSGKSKLHVKPGKDYPDDGHKHYDEKGNSVESPGVSETKTLSNTPGAVPQMYSRKK